MRQAMNLRDGGRIGALAAGLYVSVLLVMYPASTAHADTNSFAVTPPPTTIADCKKLPVSQWGLCKANVGSSEVTARNEAIDREASARTAAEMAKCKSLPYNDIFVCEEQAGYGQKVPEGLAPNQRIALQKPDAEYKAAVAACKRMPVSDWNTCISQAGYDTRLARAEG